MAYENPSRRNADGYDPETDTYRLTHDWTEDGSLGLTIVTTVAALDGRPPTDCAPIHDVVDPETVDDLFRHDDGDPSVRGEIEFRYLGYDVTVRHTGEVIVHDA